MQEIISASVKDMTAIESGLILLSKVTSRICYSFRIRKKLAETVKTKKQQ